MSVDVLQRAVEAAEILERETTRYEDWLKQTLLRTPRVERWWAGDSANA